jgi:hypothetical protein
MPVHGLQRSSARGSHGNPTPGGADGFQLLVPDAVDFRVQPYVLDPINM